MHALKKVASCRILSQDQMHISLLLIISLLYTPSKAQESFDPPCTVPFLKYGKTELLQNGMKAKFHCRPDFVLFGVKHATCIGGEWDEKPPECIPAPSTGAPVTKEVKENTTADTAEPDYITSAPYPSSTADPSDTPFTESTSLLPSSDYSEETGKDSSAPPPLPPSSSKSLPSNASTSPSTKSSTTSPAVSSTPSTPYFHPTPEPTHPSFSSTNSTISASLSTLTSPVTAHGVSSTASEVEPTASNSNASVDTSGESHPETLAPETDPPVKFNKTSQPGSPNTTDPNSITSENLSTSVIPSSTPTSAITISTTLPPLSPGGNITTTGTEATSRSPGWAESELKPEKLSPAIIWTIAVSSVVALVVVVGVCMWRLNRRRHSDAWESGDDDSEFVCLTSDVEQSGL